jgi:hypothetical protein
VPLAMFSASLAARYLLTPSSPKLDRTSMLLKRQPMLHISAALV